MRIAKEITTRRIESGDDAVPVSEVLRDGTATGKRVSGAVLEAAIWCQGRYLLLMTDDVPYEDMLSIHLLDEDLDVLDSATLGAPYSSGSLSSLELDEPRTVRFRFIGDTRWQVDLLKRRGFRIPWIAEPPGVRRAFGFSRSFVVSGAPEPVRKR